MKFMQLIFPLTNAPKIHELPAIQAYVFLGVLIVFCVAGNCCVETTVGASDSEGSQNGSNAVALGDPSLTAGIPGDGELSVVQI